VEDRLLVALPLYAFRRIELSIRARKIIFRNQIINISRQEIVRRRNKILTIAQSCEISQFMLNEIDYLSVSYALFSGAALFLDIASSEIKVGGK